MTISFAEVKEKLYDHPSDQLMLVYTSRVFHKWAKDKKWKERWRAGWMPILQLKSEFWKDLKRGYTNDDCDLHGAN